jgi:hypothetical protein
MRKNYIALQEEEYTHHLTVYDTYLNQVFFSRTDSAGVR